MKNNQFSYYITKYFSEYLPSVKGVSKKTIQSYRDTFVIFFGLYPRSIQTKYK